MKLSRVMSSYSLWETDQSYRLCEDWSILVRLLVAA